MMNQYKVPRGGMCERLKQAVLKTAVPERAPGVRIPLPPPASLRPGEIRASPSLNLVEMAVTSAIFPKTELEKVSCRLQSPSLLRAFSLE
jgi:hypothetical protein